MCRPPLQRHIQYFVVEQPPKPKQPSCSNAAAPLLEAAEEGIFKSLNVDIVAAEQGAKAYANIVHGFNTHKSAVVPWLRRTSIAEHIKGLKKDEICASFALPKNIMLDVVDEILLEAHS